VLRVLALLLALALPLPVAAQAMGEGEGHAAAGGSGGVAAVAGGSGAMVTVPAGDYLPLYSPDTTRVAVASFRMDRFQVTRGEYAGFVRANPGWQRSRALPVFTDARYLADWQDDLRPGGDLAAPVTGVSWFAARAYCAWVGKRLPGVDEWEYAARADETRFDATAEPAHRQRILRLQGQRPKTPPAVGSVFRNRYGIHDMHGLVWEWVRDFNSVMVGADSRGGDRAQPQLYCAAGASGARDREDYAAFLRYAFRSQLRGVTTSAALGFRCAADLQGEP
jgi:formylglycine-generating enzyme